MNPFACCSFVESSIGFLSGLVSSAELVLLARQHRDRMLAKVTYPLIPESYHTLQAELPNLHFDQRLFCAIHPAIEQLKSMRSMDVRADQLVCSQTGNCPK